MLGGPPDRGLHTFWPIAALNSDWQAAQKTRRATEKSSLAEFSGKMNPWDGMAV